MVVARFMRTRVDDQSDDRYEKIAPFERKNRDRIG